jgi:hypothetical protein
MTAELMSLGHYASYASQINFVAVVVFLWKTAPRIDHLFESSKLHLAEASGNIGLLWAECELGKMKKLALLFTHYGVKKTMRGLLGAGIDGWKFERRINRGTWKDRIVHGDVRQRRFDDPSVVMLVSRRVCLCNGRLVR